MQTAVWPTVRLHTPDQANVDVKAMKGSWAER